MTSELLLCLDPLIIAFKVFLVTVDDAGKLMLFVAVSMSSLESGLHLLSLVLTHIDWVAAMAAAILASM